MHLLALSAGVAAAACASTPDEERRVAFSCDRGPGVTVLFGADSARIVNPDGDDILLPQRVSGSGYWYESPTHSIRGQGRAMTYTIGRMAPMQCEEAPSRM